jgi:poly(3-hydroxybutyrate) depolymerase
MKFRHAAWSIALLWIAGAVLSFAAPAAQADVLDKTKDVAGTTVHYKVVVPNGYDPAKTYPAVFAFPPGSQSMELVDEVVEKNYREQAERRGYLLVIPAAPNGDMFFEEGRRIFPAFLEAILHDYKIEGNKFHAVGMSNGGLSAFYIAALYPQYFLSITGFPGYLPDATPASVHAIGRMCINMYVGELDTDWLNAMRQQASQFRADGLRVRFSIEPGQSHIIGTLRGDGAARLFGGFDEARRGCSR